MKAAQDQSASTTVGPVSASGAPGPAQAPASPAASTGLGPVRRELFIAGKPGESVVATTFYTRPTGLDLISAHEIMKRSDTVEVSHLRYSKDNGRTWEDGEELATYGVRPGAKLRRMWRGAAVDPFSGRFLRF